MSQDESTTQKAELLAEIHGPLLQIEGYDDCIIDVITRCGDEPTLLYSVDKILRKLQAQGMEYLEAREFFEFNISGGWLGPQTPWFLDDES